MVIWVGRFYLRNVIFDFFCNNSVFLAAFDLHFNLSFAGFIFGRYSVPDNFEIYYRRQRTAKIAVDV